MCQTCVDAFVNFTKSRLRKLNQYTFLNRTIELVKHCLTPAQPRYTPTKDNISISLFDSHSYKPNLLGQESNWILQDQLYVLL